MPPGGFFTNVEKEKSSRLVVPPDRTKTLTITPLTHVLSVTPTLTRLEIAQATLDAKKTTSDETSVILEDGLRVESPNKANEVVFGPFGFILHPRKKSTRIRYISHKNGIFEEEMSGIDERHQFFETLPDYLALAWPELASSR